MFVTNWISTTKIQKISEITNFFRHYFLSRTEVRTMRLRKILMVASVTFACVAQAQDLTIHVNKKGKVGFVDKNGAEVIKCAYESAYPFSGGYAIVTKSGKSGIIDERGKVVLPLKYTSITCWRN